MNTQDKYNDLFLTIRKSSFGDALRLVFDAFDIKKGTVANEVFMYEEYIYRYTNGNNIPKKKTLVQLLIAMNIPFEISMALINAAGYFLTASAQDVFYRTILENPGTVNVLEANEMIQDFNVSVKNMGDIIPEFNLN